MSKPSQPYLWVVRVPFKEGEDRVPSLAFDQKADATRYADTISETTGRRAMTFRVVYQSEIARRLAGYRMLVEMGLAE